MGLLASLLALATVLQPGETALDHRYWYHASFTNRWATLHAGDEIAYVHRLADRRWTNVTVRVDCGHCADGACRVEFATEDGVWRPLGTVDRVGPKLFPIPSERLPCDEIRTRVTGDGAAVFAQIWGYDVEAAFDGPSLEGSAPASVVRGDVFASAPGASAVLWGASSGWRIPRNDGVPTKRGKGLQLHLARNESESVQLVVTARENLSNVRLDVGRLAAGSCVLPSAAVDVFHEGYVPVIFPTDESCRAGLYPDPIFPQEAAGVSIAQGLNQPFLIRVRAPRGQAPGVYRGTVRVLAGTRTLGEVPLAVEVLAVELPETLPCQTAFHLDLEQVCRYHGATSKADRDRLRDLYLKACADYRLSPYDPVPGVRWTVEWKDLDKGPAAYPVFDWTAWDAAMASAIATRGVNSFVLKMPHVGGWIFGESGDTSFMYHGKDDPVRDVLLAKYFKAVEAHLAEKGWLDKAFLYWFDEPTARDFPQIERAYGKIRAWAPGLRLMVTKMPQDGLRLGPNLWCPLTSHYDAAEARVRRAAGDRFWWYVCCQPKAPYAGAFIDHAGLELRTWLWQTWAEGVEGVLVAGLVSWTTRMAYPDPAHPQNPYLDTQSWDVNDTDPPGTKKPYGNGDGRFFYPPRACADGCPAQAVIAPPVASLRLEMLRDGLEDYACLDLLRQRVPNSSLLAVPPEVSRSLTAFSRDPQPLEHHRLKVLKALEKERLILCGEGAPSGRAIVMPLKTSESVRYAARELSAYLQAITGEKVPVIDDSWPTPPCAITLEPDEGLGPDGFRLLAEPPNLKIVGSAKRGLLYGVYELLESYGGVGWYATERTVVPKARAFSVPATLDRVEKPAFAVREPFWFGPRQDPDFAARLRLNGESMRPSARHGGNEFRFGGGLGNSHTLPILVPEDEFFDDHPEYFALVGDRRVRDGQLCLSNPDVLKIVTERVLERIRRDPEATYFGISQRDALGYCECPTCAAIDAAADSHAGSVITFVNAVAEAVEKEFPDKVIETLAYQFSRKPPKGIRPRANVMPCLCSIECDFKEPLAASAFLENAAFVRDLKGWGELTDKLYVWDYTTDFLQYQLPFPNVNSLQPNLKLFRDAGATTVFSEGAYNGAHAEFGELRTWLLAKLMWNPDRDADALVDQFLAGYYGLAAPHVRRYYDALNALPRDTARQPLKIYQDVDDPVLTDAFLAEALGIWREAIAAAKREDACLAQTRAGAFPIVYTTLLRRARRGVKKAWVTRHPERFKTDASTPKLLAFFEREFAEMGSPIVSESPKRHETFLSEIRALARPQAKPQKADSVRIEESELTLHEPGVCGSLVDDPAAENGRAIRLGNDHHKWCVVLRLREVAYDPNVTYRLSARVRVVKGSVDEQVFSCGVYDDATRRSCGAREPKLSEVGDGYVWYDVLDWEPSDSQYVWFAPGWFVGAGPARSHDGIYLDSLELRRLSR